MVALFTLIALGAAQRALARDSSLGWAAIVIAIALGSWTIPVMAFPAAAIFAWMALEAAAGGASMGGRPFVVRFILCILATAAMTLALYAPTLLSNALWELTGNRWVKSLGVTRFLNDLRNLPIEVARSWMPEIRWPVALPIHLAAVASMFLPARYRKYRIPILPVAMIASAVVLCVVMRVPPARVWLWLLPLYLGGAAITFTVVARAVLEERLAPMAVSAASILIAVALGVWLTYGDSLRNSRDTGLLQRANIVASTLRAHLQPTDRVVVSIPASEPLRYYLQRSGFDHDVSQTIAPRRVFIVWTSDDITRGIESPTEMLTEYGVDPNKFQTPAVVREFTRTKIYAAKRRARAATRPTATQVSN
jgi:hypothetical protein